MSGFSSYNFAGDEKWQEIERNLYFSTNDQAEQKRILRKRQQKYYKANVDPDYEIVEAEPAKPASSSSTTSSSSSERPQQSYTPPPSSSSSSSSARPSSSSSSPPSRFAAYSRYVSWIQLALHSLIIVNVVTYLLPLLGAEQQGPSFTRVMVLNLMAQAVYLLRQHGRPRWNAEYGRALFMDEQAHFMFLSIVLMNANGMMILLAPFLIRSALFVAGGLKQLLPRMAPKIWSLVSGPVDKFVGMYQQLYGTNAFLEVMGGFAVILNLLTPARNFMLVFGIWQYLRVRYMLSDDSKRAWAGVKTKTDGWIAHPAVPAPVKAGYAKVCSMAEQYSDMAAQAQQAQQSGGGLMSKCSIM